MIKTTKVKKMCPDKMEKLRKCRENEKVSNAQLKSERSATELLYE
jgi:hypothetical protein